MRDRSVGEILILFIGGTVCLVLLMSLLIIGIIEIANPEADTSGASGLLASIVNTLLGLLAGFIAGRTDTVRARDKAERELSQ